MAVLEEGLQSVAHSFIGHGHRPNSTAVVHLLRKQEVIRSNRILGTTFFMRG
jgi:hypothetical protein